MRVRGRLEVSDPDGIVVDARFVAADAWPGHLAGSHRWVREPVIEWAEQQREPAVGGDLRFRYRLDGSPGSVEVVRLSSDG